MYATVRRFEGARNPKEIARRVREGFVPMVQGIDGFIAYYWVDAGNGVVISTSIYESEAAAEESNRKSAEWMKQNLADLATQPPQITSGTVEAEAHTAALPRPERREAAREAPAVRH